MSRCEYHLDLNIRRNKLLLTVKKVETSELKLTPDEINKGHSRNAILKHLASSDVKNHKRKSKVFLKECKFKLVRDVFAEMRTIEVEYEDDWVLAWTDSSLLIENFTRMKQFQKINHFPGMGSICKKDLLARNLNRMKKELPEEYNFYPVTFPLPEEANKLSKYGGRKKKSFFIIKPDKSCQGAGIDLVKGIPDKKRYHNVVCQKYICKPLLMGNYKFDLRLYVLVTSVCPLRVYVYKEGLVRLATLPYKEPDASNMNEKRMHLTNYAVNKTSDCSMLEGSKQCKRSFADLDLLLEALEFSRDDLWIAIDDIVVKTLFAALPTLEHMLQTTFPIASSFSPCFELLGFDILLGRNCKPYLLEVNRSPSLSASSAFDRELKHNLVKNVLQMVCLTPAQIKFINREQHLKAVNRLTNATVTRNWTPRERILAQHQLQKELRMMGNFRLVYPASDGKYCEVERLHFNL